MSDQVSDEPLGNSLGQAGLFSNTLFEQMYDLSTNLVNSTSTTQSLVDTMTELKSVLEQKMSKTMTGLNESFNSSTYIKQMNATADLFGKKKQEPSIVNNITNVVNNYYNSKVRNTNVAKTESKKGVKGSGGYIAGTPGVDKIPAMLTNGEYVINAESARRLGPEFLTAMNSYGKKGFYRGGPIRRKGGGIAGIVNMLVGIPTKLAGALGGGALNALLQKSLDLFGWSVGKFNSGVMLFIKSIPKLIAAPYMLGLKFVKMFATVGNKIIEERNNIRQTLSDMRDTASMFSFDTGEKKTNPQGVNRFMKGDLRRLFLAVDSTLVNTFGRGDEGLTTGLTSTKENIAGMGDYMETVGKGIFGDPKKMVALHRAVGSLGLESEDIFINAQQASKDQESIFARLHKVLKLNKKVAKEMGVDEKRLALRFNALKKDITNFGGMSDQALMNVAARMNKLKVSTEDALGVFNKFTDFESAAKSASMLSQAFGMNVDALKLIKAEDPMEIIEHMRDAFLETGRSFDKMTRFERGLLERETGISSKTLKSIMQYRKMGYSMEEAKRRANKGPEDKQIKALTKLTEAMSSFKETINTLVFDSPLDAMSTMLSENIRVSEDGTGTFGQISKVFTDIGLSVGKLDLTNLKTIFDVFMKPFIKDAQHDVLVLGKIFKKTTTILEELLAPKDKRKQNINAYIRKNFKKDGKEMIEAYNKGMKNASKKNDPKFKKYIKARRQYYSSKVKEIFNIAFGNDKDGLQLGKSIGELGLKAVGIAVRTIGGGQDIVFGYINNALEELRSYIRGDKDLNSLKTLRKITNFIEKKLDIEKGELFDIGTSFVGNVGKTGVSIFSTAWTVASEGIKELIRQFQDPNSFLSLEVIPMMEPVANAFGDLLYRAMLKALLMLDDTLGGFLQNWVPNFERTEIKDKQIAQSIFARSFLLEGPKGPEGKIQGFEDYLSSPVLQDVERSKRSATLARSSNAIKLKFKKEMEKNTDRIETKERKIKQLETKLKSKALTASGKASLEAQKKSIEDQMQDLRNINVKYQQASNLASQIRNKKASHDNNNKLLQQIRFLLLDDRDRFSDTLVPKGMKKIKAQIKQAQQKTVTQQKAAQQKQTLITPRSGYRPTVTQKVMEEVLFHPRYSEILADFKTLNKSVSSFSSNKDYEKYVVKEFKQIQKKYKLSNRNVGYEELKDARLVQGPGSGVAAVAMKKINKGLQFFGVKPMSNKLADPEFGPVMETYRKKGGKGTMPKERLKKLLNYSRNQIFGSFQSYILESIKSILSNQPFNAEYTEQQLKGMGTRLNTLMSSLVRKDSLELENGAEAKIQKFMKEEIVRAYNEDPNKTDKITLEGTNKSIFKNLIDNIAGVSKKFKSYDKNYRNLMQLSGLVPYMEGGRKYDLYGGSNTDYNEGTQKLGKIPIENRVIELLKILRSTIYKEGAVKGIDSPGGAFMKQVLEKNQTILFNDPIVRKPVAKPKKPAKVKAAKKTKPNTKPARKPPKKMSGSLNPTLDTATASLGDVNVLVQIGNTALDGVISIVNRSPSVRNVINRSASQYLQNPYENNVG